MELNVLLRGQSNAQLLAHSPDWGQVATELQTLLGFNGTTNTVNLLENDSSATNNNTVVGGTAFITDWVQPVNGNWQNGWTNNTLETGLLNYIGQLPAAERAAPTAVVWLQNEYDSTNPNLTTAEWTSAVQFEAQQVRAALGQSAATVPYVFINAIPYGDNLIPAVNQGIKLGMEQLAANPSFHATVGAQADDTNMDYGQTGVYGGPHMGIDDSNQTDQRLAVMLAQEFAQYALPGSPAALGQVDGYGPEAVTAQAVSADQVLVTVALDTAPLSATLDQDAANGVGWTIQDGSTTLTATSAKVTDGSHILLTFGAAVPTDAASTLYYAYGYGRLATSGSDPGLGNAIYDTQQMPVWTPATGLPVTGGTAAGQFTEENLVTGGTASAQGTTSSVTGYQSEFIALGPDRVMVTATTPNAFLVAGAGPDELVASSGSNLLDAGANATLMIGGTGHDMFAVDAANNATTWDAIANFHSGDTLVIWGASEAASHVAWSGGTSGQTMLTVTGGGVGTAAVDFVGLSAADAAQLKLGGGTAGGMSYLTVTHS